MEYLDVEDLLALVDILRAGPVRDVGLLDSAAVRARSTVFGQDAYPTLELKAAAMLHSICSNHALIDGNKRLAWLACQVLLDLNGHESSLTQDEAFDLTMSVAEGESDLKRIAAGLAVRPISS